MKSGKKKWIIAVTLVILISLLVSGSIYYTHYIKKKEIYDKIQLDLKESNITIKYGETIDLNDFILTYDGGTISIENEIDYKKIGENKIIYKVTAEGGIEKKKELTVNIIDDIAPVITIDNENIVLKTDEEADLLLGVEVSDNYDENLIESIVVTGEVDVKTPGIYEIKYDVKDSSNNNAESKLRIYTVQSIPVLEIGKTYEYTNSLGGSSYTLKENNQVEAMSWATNGGGSEYKGTYRIEQDKIIIKLTQMFDYTEWVLLDEAEAVYTITDNNQFESEDGIVYKAKM